MNPIIEFKDYSFKYRSQIEPTLLDINLKIYPGEKVLIVGPSGSGKSTLAHCINGLVPSSFSGDIKGELIVNGKDPAKAGVFEMSKVVGTVLQDTDGQFIGLTVAEDIAFSLENDCVPQEEIFEKVDAAAKLVDVSNFLDHAPGALSGGQKQRVSMAGVVVDPIDILLFDEPLANLDPATGKNTIALIDDICKEKKTTVIIIEHRLEDVLFKDVDRIVVVGEGRIVADATPDEILCMDILQKQGIREPLYIAALKHAGCELLPEQHPQHVETFDFASHIERVQCWAREWQKEEECKAQEKLLEVSHVSFSYKTGEKVLDDVNFDIHRGEMTALVGKNGAGKSTLASLICGFYMPNEGSFLFKGKDLKNYSIKERGEKIGYVMQSPNQMISKPMIFDEVALGLRVRNVNEDEVKSRVEETLKICGLFPYRKWPVSALSFGQKKRVSIASILVMNPEILILDEPTAGQDYHHYTEIMEFLKKINKQLGITILMITHDMHLMLEYTDRAIVLADGKLLADDRPSKILTNEEIADKAYLKKTSLYDMALSCKLTDPSAFVEHFIRYERGAR